MTLRAGTRHDSKTPETQTHMRSQHKLKTEIKRKQKHGIDDVLKWKRK